MPDDSGTDRCARQPGDVGHATAIDLLIGKSPTPNQGFDKPLTKAQVLAAASPPIKS